MTRRTYEPFKSASLLEYVCYEADEKRRALCKCIEWTDEDAILKPQAAGYIKLSSTASCVSTAVLW